MNKDTNGQKIIIIAAILASLSKHKALIKIFKTY